MRNAVLLLLIVALFSCSAEKRKIEERIISVYSTKIVLGDTIKDKLLYQISRKDIPPNINEVKTIWYKEKAVPDTSFFRNKVKDEKIGNKTYSYIDDKLASVMINNNDTLFYYDADNLKNPDQYFVLDRDSVETIMYSYYTKVKTQAMRIRKNNNRDPVYIMYLGEYIPDQVDLEMFSPAEIEKKKEEARKVEIAEYEYIYAE
ncbi:hypothetical protein [Fulvitalea axinellae]